VTVILIPLFFGVEGGFDKISGYFFCSFCPAGTLEASVPINLQLAALGDKTFASVIGGFAGSVKFWIMIVFLVGFVYFQRPFCKVVCPIGAFLGLFNRVSFFLYGRKRKDCNTCQVCLDICPEIPDVDISSDPADCIRCYTCSPSPCMEDWVLEIDYDLCKGCGICYKHCPSGAIERGPDKKPKIADLAKCTGCGVCVERCPKHIIKLHRSKDAPAAEESQLMKSGGTNDR